MSVTSKRLDADTAIIGAGIAGLTAARALQEQGRSCVVLEAAHRIGGRAYSEMLEPGIPFDLGAHWIHSDEINPFTEFARQCGAELKPTSRHYVIGDYFEDDHWLPESAGHELLQFFDAQFARINQSANSEDADRSVLEVIDTDSRWTPYFCMFFAQNYVCDVDRMSVRDAVAYHEQGADQAIASGLGNLVQSYGSDLPVWLNSAVTDIDWSGPAVKITTGRGVLRVANVILTISTGVLATRQIRFLPQLPDWKLEAINALPMGSCSRIGLSFKESFLQELPDRFTVRLGDDDPVHFRNRPCGLNFVEVSAGGRVAEWLEKTGEAAALDFILARLRRVLGNGVSITLQHKIVSAWDGDAWTRGAYSYARPGSQQQRQRLAEPIDNRLYFAGEATSVDYYATLHGAYFSARNAVSLL